MRCIHHPCAKPAVLVAHRRDCPRMLAGQCQCADDGRRVCCTHAHFSLRPTWLALQVRVAHREYLEWLASLEERAA